MSRRKTYRTCPVCGQVKLIEERSQTCSFACGQELRRRNIRADKPVEAPAQGADQPAETHRIEGDTWEISLPRTRIKTLDELVAACSIDLTEWAVERFIVNKWEVGAKTDKGIEVEPLFQVKAWLRRNKELLFVKREIEAMRQAAAKWAPKKFPVPQAGKSGKLLEVSISDLHVGRYSWGKSTGHGDYDSRIALERLRGAISTILHRAEPWNPERVLLILGNDLLNIDNLEGATTHGTRQDTDTRFQKLFSEVRSCYTEIVEQILKRAPVDIVVVPGNHDTLASWHLGESLAIWFRNSKHVRVDNEPTSRKYYQWGNVGLMFTHGDRGKKVNYPMVFAAERPQMFGQCRWKEVHIGHWHHTVVEDRFGTIIRVLPTLASQSHWESESMYIGSVRSAEAFVWDRELGLVGTVVHYLPVPKEGEGVLDRRN
jgi:hypothetical protein